MVVMLDETPAASESLYILSARLLLLSELNSHVELLGTCRKVHAAGKQVLFVIAHVTLFERATRSPVVIPNLVERASHPEEESGPTICPAQVVVVAGAGFVVVLRKLMDVGVGAEA